MGCDGKTPLPITAFSRVLPRQHLTKLLYLPTCDDFQKMRQRMQRQIEKRRTQREKGRPAFRVFARRAVAFAHTGRQSSLPFPLAHIPFLSSLPPQRTEHYLFRALRWVIERGHVCGAYKTQFSEPASAFVVVDQFWASNVKCVPPLMLELQLDLIRIA